MRDAVIFRFYFLKKKFSFLLVQTMEWKHFVFVEIAALVS